MKNTMKNKSKVDAIRHFLDYIEGEMVCDGGANDAKTVAFIRYLELQFERFRNNIL